MKLHRVNKGLCLLTSAEWPTCTTLNILWGAQACNFGLTSSKLVSATQ